MIAQVDGAIGLKRHEEVHHGSITITSKPLKLGQVFILRGECILAEIKLMSTLSNLIRGIITSARNKQATKLLAGNVNTALARLTDANPCTLVHGLLPGNPVSSPKWQTPSSASLGQAL
jgi:hypothetical protein